jgi:hypothetical protein
LNGSPSGGIVTKRLFNSSFMPAPLVHGSSGASLPSSGPVTPRGSPPSNGALTPRVMSKLPLDKQMVAPSARSSPRNSVRSSQSSPRGSTQNSHKISTHRSSRSAMQAVRSPQKRSP